MGLIYQAKGSKEKAIEHYQKFIKVFGTWKIYTEQIDTAKKQIVKLGGTIIEADKKSK